MAKIHVIIPAAGSGSRMQHQTPKQFISVGGKSLLESVESIFSNILAIDTISIAINDTDMFIESINLCKENYGELVFESFIRTNIHIDQANAMEYHNSSSF